MDKGQAVPFSCSLGVTNLQESDSPDTLLDRADKALYLAKKHGKNQVFCLTTPPTEVTDQQSASSACRP